MSGSRCQGQLFQAWPIIKTPVRQTTASRDSRIVDRRPHLNKSPRQQRHTSNLRRRPGEIYVCRLPPMCRRDWDWVPQCHSTRVFTASLWVFLFVCFVSHWGICPHYVGCVLIYVKPIIRFEIILQCENKQEQGPPDRVMDQLKWWARLKNGFKSGSFYKNSFAYEPEYIWDFADGSVTTKLPAISQMDCENAKVLSKMP